MKYRFEITLLVLVLMVGLFSTLSYLLFARKIALENRKAQVRKAVFKKARIGLSDQEIKYMLRGMMAKTISFHVVCRGSECQVTLSSTTVDYPSAMDALLRMSEVFDCGAKTLCMGIGCPIPFKAEVNIYARKNNR